MAEVITPAVVRAANRLNQMDYPGDNTPGQTLDEVIEDSQIVAKALLLLFVQGSQT